MINKQVQKNGEFREYFSDDLNKEVGFLKSGKILKDKTEAPKEDNDDYSDKKEDDDDYSEIIFQKTFQNKKRNYKKLL